MHVGGTYATLGCFGAGVMGVAPVDKGNRQPSDVGFVFSGQNSSVQVLAITIAHEAGHSFGLDHVNERPDIMYPAVNNQVTGFLNSTVAFGQQNEPVLLNTALGQGPATVIDAVSGQIAQQPATPAAPAAPSATPAPAPAPKPTQVASAPSAADLGKLLQALQGLGGASGGDLLSQLGATAASIFHLDASKQAPGDLIHSLQVGAQSIGSLFSGGQKDQLLGLLKTVGADQYGQFAQPK